MEKTTTTQTLETRLAELHSSYVTAVNSAVEHDDFVLADELAAAYDRDAMALMRASEQYAA